MAASGSEPESKGAPGEGKKLFVHGDDSWKAQAQREKDRLQEKVQAEESRGELPPPSFMGFIGELGIQALLALGLMALEGQPPQRDLPVARHTIDLLAIIEEKTKGNLKPEEAKQLEELLHSLRLNYARIARSPAEPEKKAAEPEKKIIT